MGFQPNGHSWEVINVRNYIARAYHLKVQERFARFYRDRMFVLADRQLFNVIEDHFEEHTIKTHFRNYIVRTHI